MEIPPLTWIILAGGASSRMGQPKHLLPWGRGTMLDEAVGKAVRMGAAEILVSAQTVCSDLPCYGDIYPQSGSLAGVHACLRHAGHGLCMVLPVDVPMFPELLVAEMARCAMENNYEYMPLQWNGKIEPAVAIIHRNVCGVVEEMLRNRQLRM